MSFDLARLALRWQFTGWRSVVLGWTIAFGFVHVYLGPLTLAVRRKHRWEP